MLQFSGGGLAREDLVLRESEISTRPVPPIKKSRPSMGAFQSWVPPKTTTILKLEKVSG